MTGGSEAGPSSPSALPSQASGRPLAGQPEYRDRKGFAPSSRVPLKVALVAAFVAVCAAGLGGLATDLGPWYRELQQPAWKPPDLLFGPVWTMLYTLTAWAGARAWWRAGLSSPAQAPAELVGPHRLQRSILVAFVLNGVLNVLWSALFFLARRPDWALLEMVLLAASVCWLIMICARVDRLASRLLWPYLAWVLFAATVNAGVIRRNPLPPGTWGSFT